MDVIIYIYNSTVFVVGITTLWIIHKSCHPLRGEGFETSVIMCDEGGGVDLKYCDITEFLI